MSGDLEMTVKKRIFSLVFVLSLLFVLSVSGIGASAVDDIETTVADTEYSGFVEIDTKLYYFYPDTHLQLIVTEPGIRKIEDKYYYFYADSSVFTADDEGVCEIDGAHYLTDEDNSILFAEAVNSFVSYGGKTYLAVKDGKLAVGLTAYNSRVYCFDENSAEMVKGWHKDKSGDVRYFDAVSAMMLKGLRSIGGRYYYLDNTTGVMKTGFVRLNNVTRYFSPTDGHMLTGLQNIGGKYYCFDAKSGAMKTGFVKDGSGKIRYFDPSTGVMLTGFRKIGTKYYFLNSKTGCAYVGVLKDSQGRIRCFDKNTGAMLTGLCKYGNYYYWFDVNTGYRRTGIYKSGSTVRYFLPSNGRMATGWNKIGGSYYYFNPSNGKMVTNSIVGKYYVLKNGKMATSKAVKYAVYVVNAATTPSMTKEQKLRACYNWIIRNCSYERDYQDPARLNYNWTKSYAEYLFAKKRGNCYKYAGAMGYCAAVLGYPSRVAYGKIASGSSMTNHGWTEVAIDGKIYLFDTVQADYSKGNYYKRTYSNYPKKLKRSGACQIVLS